MSKAIMRWTKVTSQEQANKATGHNYRTDRVRNADEQAPHPNVELVNMAGRGYWELAEERIKEAVTRKVRDDQVRCMEVILTASPEFFERDAKGRAVDMSQSQWLKDQLTFLEKTFGKENVLSCTLHQDEKTPHVHAVIAPITKDGRLSAKLLFNPVTMTDYQGQYAKAMKPHGLERGVEHSQAKHQPMQQMYGQQNKTAAELDKQMGEAKPYVPAEVDKPKHFVVNPEEWADKQTQAVNEKVRQQVEAANKRAEKARILALENASAKEQVRVLQKQLATSEGLKEGYKAQSEEAVKRIAGGEVPHSLVSQGNKLLDEAIRQLRDGRDSLRTFEHWGADKYADRIKDQIAKNKAMEADLGRFAGGRSRLKELDEEATKLAAEQTRAAQRREEIAQADRVRAQKAEALRVQKHELSVMDQAFTTYRWKIGPDELTACLLVPKDKAEKVAGALRIDGSSYAAPLAVQGEPLRKDGLEAVYVKYQASFAHKMGAWFDEVRKIGGQVYEHAGSQTRREQLEAKPQQKAQEREQRPAPAQDREMD